MTRLFLSPEKLFGEKIMIDGEQARYLSLVLRVKPGEQLVIFDGSGHKYFCKVLLVHKKEVVVEKIKKEPYSAESPVHISLAQGLPKSDKMDFIVQKATELGVNKIIPLITERSQVKHTEKIERWRKIALSASQQCGREQIPEIDGPVEFGEFIRNTPLTPLDRGECNPPLEKGNCRIIFSEEQRERNLKKILTGFKDTKNITLLIGPEGGFTREEVSSAVEKGFIEASLGRRILRTETAPLTAISIIQYELGDMG
ncbi:MAG: 16S rRNA (uracil(1498)-N(3))-methyltransferase [Nitrospirae bacterium]|nr:16S rRNA (uracil(1498)-N(3))-methyltransferase [Nitrospirota bacterium]